MEDFRFRITPINTFIFHLIINGNTAPVNLCDAPALLVSFYR